MILLIPLYMLLVYNNDCDKHDLGMLNISDLLFVICYCNILFVFIYMYLVLD